SSKQQHLPSSVITTAHLTPVHYRNQNQYSITASVPHQPHLNTTINLSQNLIEKSKHAFEVNIQAEYHQKGSSSNINSAIVEDEEIIHSETRVRTDYGKKALALVARNYHLLKFIALCLAFVINFLMLFYKAIPTPSTAAGEAIPSDVVEHFDNYDNEI
ncbi:unnamed protein product, partial [Adineta steineri]